MRKMIFSTLVCLILFGATAQAQKKEKVILDTDMVEVFDDGITMMMLANAPNIDLIGVTIVVGNTWVPEGTAYAIRQLEDIGKSHIPVVPGIRYPIFPSRFETIQNEPGWEDPLKTENTNEWVVLASLGSGRSSSGSPQFLNASNSDLYTGLLRAPGVKSAATILAPADFSSRKFHAPLSFGLRAGKQLSEKVSIESGLVYTYLLTDLESPNYTARLNLHYLGIPLNTKLNVWTNRQWSVYASGGAMLEKGLQSVYVQTQQIGNQTITTSASTDIDGFQWSVNAAVGVAYNFAGAFDFYFEPGFAYFFDNDQPLSIRSDRQFAPGVEVGIRFAF